MKASLRFDHATLRRGGRLLFENLSIQIGPGETLHVKGPNGSGKSSLIRLGAGLLEPESGTVERSSTALCDDHLALDRDLTLSRALSFWGGSVERAMAQLGIDHLAQVPVRLLSSGQAKRAALARVAASSALLWLLDEPLNGLDSEGAERLTHIIAKHRENGGTLLVASHQPLAGDWRTLELGQ